MVEPLKLNATPSAPAQMGATRVAPTRATVIGGAAAGAGTMAVILSLVQGDPKIVATVVNSLTLWGPALLILAGLWVLLDRHAVPLVQAISDGAIALHRCSAAMEQSREHEISTTMALNTLAGKTDELATKVEELTELMRGRK